MLNEILNCFRGCWCVGKVAEKLGAKVIEYLLVLGELKAVLVYFCDRSGMVVVCYAELSISKRAAKCCKC